MPIATVNGIDICYETSGDPDAEPVLLVMGFTAQLITWPDEFVQALVDRGFYVIRHDNRDSGLSHKTPAEPPDAAAILARTMEGEDVTPDVPYTLSAMSDDAVGLIEHLGYESAHVVGVSMGGMIVQVMAIEHPERLRSVTSIMSTTGDRSVGKPTREALTALLAPPADGREAVIAQTVERNRILAGPLWDREESEIRCAATYDRSFYPAGAAFQQAAIYATGDRTEGLRSVEVPFLVVHGREDSIISWTGGIATAEAVAGADLLVLAEMGHELSSKVIPQVADAIHAIAHR